MAKVLREWYGIETDLNDRQIKFCEEYLKELNGTKAYMTAYPDVSFDSARASSAETLAKPSVKAFISKLIDLYTGNVDITVGEIVNGLKEIALDPTSRKSDKIKAFELLARYKDMFVEKKEVKVSTSNISEADIDKQLAMLED